MKVGAVFPQIEIGGDVAALRAYGQAVEELGFHHVLAYDHVVGADPAHHAGWSGPYDVTNTFHEPFVMFGYLAALTRLELVTGIVILPQRQTVLAAKQAAEVDLLTEGRFRLGVGIGWNRVEYESMGQPFAQRGRRLDEQVGLLRALWTQPSVVFDGAFDHVPGAGIAPLPVQRPIPIWIGGLSEAAFRRMGALADGWFPLVQPGPELDRALEVIAEAAVAAGRDPAVIGMEGRVSWTAEDPDAIADRAQAWRTVGASHLTVDTMYAGLRTVDEHIAALARTAELVGLR